MNSELIHIIYRAIAEPAYRDLLFSGSPRALEDFELTSVERARISAITPEQFYTILGGMVTHSLVPLRVAGQFVVIPGSLNYDPLSDDIPLIIGPGWTFGNGAHATTELSLTAIDRYIRPGDSLLDIGTGTGILSIAAAQLGAASVLALDADPEAVEAARQNVQFNKVEAVVRVEPGTLEDALNSKTDGWNMVVVNILGPVILRMLEDGLANTLQADGVLIASAIKTEELETILSALSMCGMMMIEHRQKRDWHTLIARNGEGRNSITIE